MVLGTADSRVEQILSGTIGIDMNNHVYPAGGNRIRRTIRLKREVRDFPEGGDYTVLLTAVCASRGLDFVRNKKPGAAWERFLRWLTAVDAQLKKEQMRRALKRCMNAACGTCNCCTSRMTWCRRWGM